jgi:O-antigen ligase
MLQTVPEMKSFFLLDDTAENKISFWLLAAFLVSLPFNHFYSEWLLIIFCLHTLVHFSKKSLSRLREKKIWIIALPFLVSVAFLLFSKYKEEGIKDVSQQLAFVLFPVFLSLSKLDLNKYKFHLLEIFGFTCTLTVLYLFIHAIKVIFYFHLPLTSIVQNSFLNQNFSSPIELHATYLSMYVLLSICIFIYRIFTQKKRRIINLICCLILFAGLIQLCARAPFLAAEIIFLFVIPFMLLEGRKRIWFVGISLLATIVFFITVYHSDSLRKRYLTDLRNDLSNYRDPGDLTESRWRRWELEWQLFIKSPLTGYGTGSEKYILRDKFYDNKFYRAFLLGLNAHNQYLSIMLNEGVIGLFFFLGILVYSFSIAFNGKDFLLCCFLLILSVVSVSENVLGVSKGVMFYSFFFSFFLLTQKPSEKISHNFFPGQPAAD